jgi:hypothetical protein
VVCGITSDSKINEIVITLICLLTELAAD